jgi:hypothetical protein
MLNAAERDCIREHGYCTHHAVRINSIFQGEPFLDDGLLCYFDGRRLFVCGYPLDRSSNGLIGRVQGVVRRWVKELPVEIVSHCGPESVPFTNVCPRTFRCTVNQAADPIKAELALDCSGEPPNRRLRRWLRSPRRAALRTEEQCASGFVPRAATLQLIEEFFACREITPYLLDIAFALPALATMGDVLWFEAYERDTLRGVAICADAFETIDLGLFIATVPGATGASDALYAAIADSARRRAKRYVNWGPSPSSGHHWFKQKWGAVELAAPYYYSEWVRGGLAGREYTSWPSRLLQYDFRPATAGPSLDRQDGRRKHVAPQVSRSK